MRHEVTIYTISELRKHFQGRIIVADDSYEIDKKSEKWFTENTEFYRLQPNIGLSAGRNFLLSKSNAEFFLLMDNDFLLKDLNAIFNLEKIINHTDADIVGGLLWDFGAKQPRNYCGFFEKHNKEIVVKLYDIKKIPIDQIDDLQFYPCRICQNFFIARKSTFLKYHLKWDENLKVYEHEDFFIKIPNKVKIFETPSVHVVHYPSLEKNFSNKEYKGFNGIICDENYSKFRYNYDCREILKKRYNLSGPFFKIYRDCYFNWKDKNFPSLKEVKIL